MRRGASLQVAVALVLASCGGGELPPAPAATAPPAGTVVIHDLIAMLPELEQRREVALLDLGASSARAHLLGGWLQDEVDEKGRTFVWASGHRAAFDFYLDRPRDVSLELRCWPLGHPGAPPQRITVSLNDRAVGFREIGEGEGTVAFALPAASTVAGDNVVALSFAWSRRPADVIPGNGDDRDLAVCVDEIRLRGCVDAPPVRVESGGRLEIAGSSRLDAYLALPAGAVLVTDAASTDAPLHVEVELDGGGPPRVQEVAGGRPVDLGMTAPGIARVSLRAGGDPRKVAALVAPRIAAPGGQPAEAGTASLSGGDPHPGLGVSAPDVLLYVVDALRADRLGAYGAAAMASPALDALSRGATLHERALAPTSWTRPSSATLLTGLPPSAHGVVNRESAIPPELPALPGILKEHGFRTAVLVTNTHLAAAFGFDRGCDHYEQLREEATAEVHQPASTLHARYLAWLDEGGTAPSFAMLHASDVHTPYVPRAPFRQLLAPGLDGARLGSNARVIELKERGRVTEAEAAPLSALYDAEILGLDADIARLRAALARRGRWERTFLVLTGDHGETFGERETLEHGDTLYEEVLHVPLLVREPGRSPAIEAALARHVDVLPTILGRLGITPRGEIEGRRLDEPPVEERSIAQLDWGLVGLSSLTTGGWQLVRTDRHPRAARRWELFELGSDPGGLRDVAARRPVMRGYLAAELARLESEDGEVTRRSVELDPEVKKTLEALGYVD